MKKGILALLLCLAFAITGCGESGKGEMPEQMGGFGNPGDFGNPEMPGGGADLGDDATTFGDAIEETGAYDGYFEGESLDVFVECVSGTAGAYRLEGSTLTFTAVDAETVYSVSGKFKGNIIIDTGDDYKFDLELHGFSLVCDTTNPITVKSGDEVAIKAKKDTKNYIYDMRALVDSSEEGVYSGAIHSEVDLEIGGRGEMYIVSENNNGIHSKDDLQVKNLTLFVACIDNSLKGNDGVEIEGGSTTLIASCGDCIKTTKSDVSEKGNQRGSVMITGGTHTLYAACDGIDAAYDVCIDDSTTSLNIYTDKYSNYSKEVNVTSSDENYIRFTSNAYYYSVKYYNSDTDYVWVNAEYHSQVSGSRMNYYYYSYPKMPSYAKQQFFIYESAEGQGQDKEYLVMSDYLTQNTACDTFALTSSYNGLTYQWTNYTTKIQEGGFGGHGGPGGPGGMGGGNTDKGDYSTKGIKASNEIVINEGSVNIKAYDDAIHANKDSALENGEGPLGNITVKGGSVTVYSNDDGIHADGALSVTGGTVNIANSYEGIEGASITVSGGHVSVRAKDDGVNATATTGTAVSISGGEVYIYCLGDGIDSNSRTSYCGIVFLGGKTVVISNSSGNSAIDTEQGYSYTGGEVIAIMPRGGMSSEATHCQGFAGVGRSTQVSVTQGAYLTVGVGNVTATVQMPASMSAIIVVLGDTSPTVSVENSTSHTLDANGVAWH